MSRNTFRLGIIFIALMVAALVYWVSAIISGHVQDLIDGLGVEILGAIITGLGVLFLERVFSDPDPRLKLISKQLDEQSRLIGDLQAQLSRLSRPPDEGNSP